MSCLGEIGLYYYTHSSTVERERQQHFLKKLLPVAAEKQRRIVIHCREGPTPREAQSDLLDIMKELLPPPPSESTCTTSAEPLPMWTPGGQSFQRCILVCRLDIAVPIRLSLRLCSGCHWIVCWRKVMRPTS